MKENKLNVFLLITSVLSISVLVVGATYSFFTMSAMSRVNAVSVEAGKSSTWTWCFSYIYWL